MRCIKEIDEAVRVIAKGGVVAYPTEAVYGLGCDPFNQEAVYHLLSLKARDVSKGLIVLISNWQQLNGLIDCVADCVMEPVRASWPGPVTWVFPKAQKLPRWLTGDHESIAIRMTEHPIAKALCRQQPIVSTSANQAGHVPARNIIELNAEFPTGLDGYVDGALGGATSPSSIYDVLTGIVIR